MSELPRVDTFEYDISEEIKSKGVSIRDIAASSVTIENKPESSSIKNSSVFIILSIIFLFLSIAGIIWYMIFIQNQSKALTNNKIKESLTATIATSSLQNSLPVLNESIGRFVSKMIKTQDGYDLILNDHNQVFSYVVNNENSFAIDCANLFNIEIVSSSTVTFNDITIMNQNMRVLNNASNTLAYAFINSDHLLLSTSTEGIMSMRGAIIK